MEQIRVERRFVHRPGRRYETQLQEIVIGGPLTTEQVELQKQARGGRGDRRRHTGY